MTSPEPHWRPARLLDDGRKLAATACIVLIVSLFLPWYEKSVVPTGAKTFVTTSLSAFGSFTWIEAALLLVDAAVLGLLYLRSAGRRVELPGSDGTMIALAGAWIGVLLIVRVFDKPTVSGTGATVGLQWGLLVAMAAAGALLAAGVATRAIEQATGRSDGAAPGAAGSAKPRSTPATVADDWSDRQA